jgi:hypothetical protein
MANFRLGTDFPREGFVQQALERHFCAPDYEPLEVGQVDLACVHKPSGERWIIEAKGATVDVGLDFRTGLGQLVQAMHDPSAKYGLAVPKTGKFMTQMGKVPDRVRQLLGIHWLIVDETGAVEILPPTSASALLGT